MIGKNNRKVLEQKISKRIDYYSIKKFKFGVASVVVGGLMFLGFTHQTFAADTSNIELANLETAPVATLTAEPEQTQPVEVTSTKVDEVPQTAEVTQSTPVEEKVVEAVPVTTPTADVPKKRSKRATEVAPAESPITPEGVIDETKVVYNNSANQGSIPEKGVYVDIKNQFGTVDFAGATDKEKKLLIKKYHQQVQMPVKS